MLQIGANKNSASLEHTNDSDGFDEEPVASYSSIESDENVKSKGLDQKFALSLLQRDVYKDWSKLETLLMHSAASISRQSSMLGKLGKYNNSNDQVWEMLDKYLDSHFSSSNYQFTRGSSRVMPLSYASSMSSSNSAENEISRMDSSVIVREIACNKPKIINILKNTNDIIQDDLEYLRYPYTQKLQDNLADPDWKNPGGGKASKNIPSHGILGKDGVRGGFASQHAFDLDLELRRQQRILYRFQLNFMHKNVSKFVESYRIREAALINCIDRGGANTNRQDVRSIKPDILVVVGMSILVGLNALALYGCILLTVYQSNDRQLLWLYCCITLLIVDWLVTETAFVGCVFIAIPSVVNSNVNFAKLIMLEAVKR